VAEYWQEDGLPWVSPKDMKVSRVRDSEDHISERALEESATQRIQPNSILLVIRSGILEHTLPVAVTDAAVAINQDMKALTPCDGVSADFVTWAVRAFGRAILDSCKKDGTTVSSLDFLALQRFQIPIAPSAEQLRIVDAVESYASRLAAAVAGLDSAQRKLKAYRASVLKAAVEGRLVPTEAELARSEGRAYEPADVLLERILKERRRRWEEAELAKMRAASRTPKDDRWKANYSEPELLAADNLPSLPEGWQWVTMGLLIGAQQNGLYVPASRYGAGVPILRIDDYQSDASRSAAELKQVQISDDDAQRYGLRINDVVLNRVNSMTHLGKALVVSERHLPAVFESNMMRLELLDGVSPRFVHFYLASSPGRNRLTKNAKWAVNQASINQADVGACFVPLPPLAEQVRIVAEVERLLSVAAVSAEALSATTTRCAALRQATLSWAFAGRLVDQDPADEPADVLLARIRAERSTAPPRGQKAKRSRKLKAAS
jgi:type I restriction enzyme S subunit